MRSQNFADAIKLLYAGRAREAEAIGQRLVRERDEGLRLSGHLCLGLVNEEGGLDLARDLEVAILHYHKAAAIAREPLTFCYLARASMKKGCELYPSALTYLLEADRLGHPVEVDLGFAHYFRTKADPQPELAKSHYLRAARRGRFAGFFGYASLCRELGQNGRAFAMDALRVLMGPFLALTLGRASRDEF